MGEYSAHAVAWVSCVAVVARDDVYVCVADGLACGFEPVESDGSAARSALPSDPMFHLPLRWAISPMRTSAPPAVPLKRKFFADARHGCSLVRTSESAKRGQGIAVAGDDVSKSCQRAQDIRRCGNFRGSSGVICTHETNT